MIGRGANSKVIYSIDFGLARMYRDSASGFHIPFNTHRSLVGTARYASINTHMGVEQGRRDDLESVGYLLVYLLRGVLPWQKQKARDKEERHTAILKKKMETPVEVLCEGIGSTARLRKPVEEFATYVNYCRTLRFQDKPDYGFLRGLFRKSLMTCTEPGGLDWEIDLGVVVVVQQFLLS